MKRYLTIVLLILLAAACSPQPTAMPEPTASPTSETDESDTPDAWPRADERSAMVEEQIAARDITDPAVLQAMRTVPRHEFVPEDDQNLAYNDHPLPIGHGQTISQPYIVALMTKVLALESGDKVLEIGTGSGYQAAILAEIVDEVYTIEIIGALVERVRTLYERLGYRDKITVKHADGYFGWEEHAPFDAIIVTAAPDHVPQPLLNQLADGGRLVIPVGPPGGYQTLWLYEREGDEFTSTNLGDVMFVPFTREER